MASDTTARVMVTVQDGKAVPDILNPDGTQHRVAVLTAGQVQNVPAFTRWFTKVGYMTAEAGIPWREAAQIQAALCVLRLPRSRRRVKSLGSCSIIGRLMHILRRETCHEVSFLWETGYRFSQRYVGRPPSP